LRGTANHCSPTTGYVYTWNEPSLYQMHWSSNVVWPAGGKPTIWIHSYGKKWTSRVRGLPNSCQTHAPKGGTAEQVETHDSRYQMLAREKVRLDMAAPVNLRQLRANGLKLGC